MLLKIIGVGVCGIVINLILKQYKPEFALMSNICCGLIMFMFVVDGVQEIIKNFVGLQDNFYVKSDIIKPIFKVVGIGYLTEFVADIADESGNKSIANKIILGGKIAICVLAIPIINMFVSAIISLL